MIEKITPNIIGVDDVGGFTASSNVNTEWDRWDYDQYSYGLTPSLSPVYHRIHGAVETDAMFSVCAQWGRWSPNVMGINPGGQRFGSHVFEGWNNIRSYRLTMLIGNNREDEACIQVFSPTNCYVSPIGELTEDQIANRITQDTSDQLGSGSTYFGRVRIGSDHVDQGYVFRRSNSHFHGNVEFYESNVGSQDRSITMHNTTHELRIGACSIIKNDGANIAFRGQDSDNGKMDLYIGGQTIPEDPSLTAFTFWKHGNGTALMTVKGDGKVSTYSDLVVGGHLKFQSWSVPGATSSTGEKGSIRYDANYIYICVATDTWKRVAIGW